VKHEYAPNRAFDIYSHVLPGLTAEAAAKMDAAVMTPTLIGVKSGVKTA
jgi:hypothetical protein